MLGFFNNELKFYLQDAVEVEYPRSRCTSELEQTAALEDVRIPARFNTAGFSDNIKYNFEGKLCSNI